MGCYSGLAGSPVILVWLVPLGLLSTTGAGLSPSAPGLDTYLHRLLRTMLILLARGRFLSGMENQVFLPMITTFCFPVARQMHVE